MESTAPGLGLVRLGIPTCTVEQRSSARTVLQKNVGQTPLEVQALLIELQHKAHQQKRGYIFCRHQVGSPSR